jgi:hypothetical protein
MVTMSSRRARYRATRWRLPPTPCTIAQVPADDDLVAHLVRSTPLTPNEAARVVAEVVAYYGEAVPDYVRRRHAELKRRGLTNHRIFDEITAELAARRFAAPPLSVRQLRRLVYG